MSKAGKKIIAGAKEVLKTIRLRGGPFRDFTCESPTIIECALWDCQKARKCRLASEHSRPVRGSES